jgi:hypothetical protein
MTQQALTIRQDQTPTTTKLTTRDVFSIWLADQRQLTRRVYEAAVRRGLRQDNPAARKHQRTKQNDLSASSFYHWTG